MATDYILFIHGVSNRDRREPPTYANGLFGRLEENVGSSVSLQKIPLYWGDVNKTEEDKLLNNFKASKAWNKLWFRDFREQQLLQFVGDAALYLSRHVGSQVVARLKQEAEKNLGTLELPKHKPGDRLHLVTHSWGTVVLFDVLFADRWEDKSIPGYQDVQQIRKALFGLPPHPEVGLPIASIHTMGSPIALFSLISVDGSSHDFKPRLNQLLENLYKVRGKKLPWLNFIHPGDPVAWPLEKVMSSLVDNEAVYLNFTDEISRTADWSDFLPKLVSQTILALLHGGDAHGSYWKSKEVAQKIAKTIQKVATQ